MKIIALRQLHGGYGTVAPGEVFTAPDDIAQQLLTRGLVRRAEPPKILYETKPAKMETPMIEAPEVSPRPPFRDMSVPDQESTELAPASDSTLPATDVPKQGTVDSRGRRRSFRFGAK
jgi:hypothetical protein